MRLKNLLVHRATLLIPGSENGTDEYNRPIFSEPTTRQIQCRMDQMRVTTSTDEQGRDVIMSYVLFVGPDENLDPNMKIYNVIDQAGKVVAEGTFSIENIFAAYRLRSLHHYEVNLSRADVAYDQPQTVVQTQVVNFAGKNTNDGDETRKIYFGLTEDE